MTTVYFVRHAQSDHRSGDEHTRGLSEKGMKDRTLVTRFLMDKGVDAAFSSPYRRAIDTIAEFVDTVGLPICTMDGFREWHRRQDPEISFDELCRRHFADFDYHYADGESLCEVQRRNVEALEQILARCEGGTVIIGTHGMALSTVIRHYDPSFGYEAFCRLLPLMPLIVKMTFEGNRCLGYEQITLT